ncbi:MAG: hypothetical protein Aurels2KO_10420 [Aureliella sp.]
MPLDSSLLLPSCDAGRCFCGGCLTPVSLSLLNGSCGCAAAGHGTYLLTQADDTLWTGGTSFVLPPTNAGCGGNACAVRNHSIPALGISWVDYWYLESVSVSVSLNVAEQTYTAVLGLFHAYFRSQDGNCNGPNTVSLIGWGTTFPCGDGGSADLTHNKGGNGSQDVFTPYDGPSCDATLVLQVQ